MPSISDIMNASPSQMESGLRAGIAELSQDQTFTFQPYVRMVLPLDGFVYWVNATLVTPAALAGAGLTSAAPIVCQGSLHYAISGDQNEDESIALHRVIFTTAAQIEVMGEEAPGAIYISSVNGVQFAFSRQDNFYSAAGLFHYLGDAVYPAMRPMIIDTLDGFDQRQVVSNSLGIWLSLNGTISFPAPVIPSPWPQLYPSFAVPDNLSPPYGSVHIPPESTRAIQAFPTLDKYNNHNQLCAERVRITFYGLRNDEALDFQDFIFQYSLMTDAIGFMNMPVLRDDKRTQNELAILAMKKTMDFEISYYQTRARTIAQQYVLSCVPGSITVNNLPPN